MKKNIYCSAAILAGVAVVIFTLSMFIEWYGDALLYQFSFKTGERIQHLSDIPASQYIHFFQTNGRIVAHILVQVFCGLSGQKVFAMCNAFVYVSLILLMIQYARGNWKEWRMTLAAALLTLFFCDTSYIPPHQIGYIWMSCTALIFLIIYSKENEASVSNPGKYLLLVLTGLICGNGNEAIDLGIGAAICIDMLTHRHNYPRRRLMLLIGFCIGLALLCLSPGIISRATGGRYRPPLILSLYTMAVSLRAFWVFAVVLAAACLSRKVKLRAFIADNRLLLTAMAVMFVFNLAITVKLNRQMFGIELYSAVLTLCLLRNSRIPVLWLFVGVIVVAGQYFMKFTTLAHFNSYEKVLRSQLAEHRYTPLYIDLTYHNPYVSPTEELTYHRCDGIYQHVYSQVTHLNGGFDCAKSLAGRPRIYIDSIALYPTALERIEALEPRNRVVHCGNGVYMLLRLKERPAQFVLHRSLDIPGFRRPLPPVDISFEASQHPSTDTYDVFVSTFPYPLMHVDSVTMNFPASD